VAGRNDTPGALEAAGASGAFDTGLAPSELDPEHPRLVETPFGAMALFVDADEILCLQAFCPHLEGPLFQGTLSRGSITCPWHFWRFDLRTGRRVGPMPLALAPCEPLRRAEVSIGAAGTIVLRAAPLP